jgi:hypothetical protein
MGGSGTALTLANFVATVKTAAIMGAAFGGISAAINGGNILEGMASGAMSAAIVAAAVYGGYKLYRWATPQGAGSVKAGHTPADYTQKSIKDDPLLQGSEVRAAFTEAFRTQQAHGVEISGSIIQDQNGYIYHRLVMDVNASSAGTMIDSFPVPEGHTKLATFHTHPSFEGWYAGPSPPDLTTFQVDPVCAGGQCGAIHYVIHQSGVYSAGETGSPSYIYDYPK